MFISKMHLPLWDMMVAPKMKNQETASDRDAITRDNRVCADLLPRPLGAAAVLARLVGSIPAVPTLGSTQLIQAVVTQGSAPTPRPST